MKVLNIHSRTINKPIEEVGALLSSLSSKDDQIWPFENWPRMKLNQGLNIGSRGGHGPIRYSVKNYKPGKLIEFTFSMPKGFHGIHFFEFIPVNLNTTQIKHIIDMRTRGKGTLTWLFAIKWLHNALIEESFDKIEKQFHSDVKSKKMGLFVKVSRWLLR